MANKIQVKRSAVAGKVPTTADIDLGEIAINTYDGKMYIKKNDGTATVIQIGDPAGFITPSSTDTLTNKTIDSYTNSVGADHVHYKIKAMEALAPGNTVKFSGWNAGENAVEVYKVSAATDVAIGICHDTLAVGQFGLAVVIGAVEGVDTSAFTEGTILYPSTTGGLTATKPTSGMYQACAFVLRSQAINGALLVSFQNPEYVESSANTANTSVIRDASGNFAAGTVTAALSGNATTATTLQTARTIQTNLASTSSASFNGSANITPGVTGTLPLGNGGTGSTTAAGARTSLGATTVGGNMFTLTNPSAVTFPRFNADNTVSALDAATFRTAIGAGTGSGTVTSVTGTSPVASSGGATPAISLAAAYGDTLNPYASKTANYVLAAPNGAAGVPTFRAIVAADIPTLNQNTTGSAATLTTARSVNGTSFNGSADITTANWGTARDINGTSVNGSANYAIGRIYDTAYKRITNPGGAEYTTGGATVTGALAITLPVGITNTMVRMTIKIYEYATNKSFEVNVGGYNYTGGTWANNPFAYIVGNPGVDRRLNVRLGYDSVSAKFIVYIGELASTWAYPQVYVTDVQCGYSGQSVNWTTGWSIGFEATAFKAVTATISNCQVGYAVSANTANSVALRDSSGNFSAGTITAALSGNATTATTLQTARTINGTSFNGSANITVPVNTSQKSDNVAYQIPFVTSVTAGNQSLYTDSAATFTYNPSTNTFTVPNIVSSLTGPSSYSHASEALIFNGSTVETFQDVVPTLTTAMALVISNTSSTPPRANFEAVVKQITSSDATITLTETSPGVWDLSTSGGGGGSWYTLQTGDAGTLATTIDAPGNFVNNPTTAGQLIVGSYANGSGWAMNLYGPNWNSGYNGNWSGANSQYYSPDVYWSSITNQIPAWSSQPNAGIVFSYMQYGPQSSNSFYQDAWGNSSSWMSGFGSSFGQMMPPSSSSTKVFYLVLMVAGSDTITANGSLAGVTLETGYDAYSNTTYAFFKCDDNSSVNNILMGINAISWSFPQNYYGHAWYEYT